MGLRPGRVDRRVTKRSFTRTAVKVHKKNFIKGIPGLKVRMFNMGDKRLKGELLIALVPKQDVQVRHNALEAGRVSSNAYMKKNVTNEEYFLKVNVFPHQILREHAQAAVAQADRFYQGMAHPFGRPKGRAARVKAGQTIISIRTSKENLPHAKEAFRRASAKLPLACRVVVKDV